MNNVVELLAKLTKELKEPITKIELAEMYNKEYGTTYSPHVFGKKDRLALKIIATDHSCQLKAQMFYIAKVPLADQKFKANLEEIGELEIDEKSCLTKLTVGGTVIFQLPNKTHYERSVHKFCTKFSKAAETPVSRNALFNQFVAHGGTGSLPTFIKAVDQVINNYMSSDRALEKKAKFCFVMGFPIADETLKELRKIATVRVKASNQIISFKSHDQKLSFSGKPRKIPSKRGKGSKQDERSADEQKDKEEPMVTQMSSEVAPEPTKIPDVPKVSSSQSQALKSTVSPPVSALKTTSTPRPSEDSNRAHKNSRTPLQFVSTRVPVDPRAIAEPPRKRQMMRSLTTDSAAKRMKNEAATNDYYERHKNLALCGQKENIHEVPGTSTYKDQHATLHEDSVVINQEAKTTYEAQPKTTHEVSSVPSQLQNLRKPAVIKPEPLDVVNNDVLVWRENPKKAKTVIKQEPKEPGEDGSLGPTGHMVHRVLEDFAEILKDQLLEIHPVGFDDLIQKWKELKEVLENGKVTLTRQELLPNFESMIQKKLKPALEFEEGTPAHKFLEDIVEKMRRHQYINVEDREERMLWKEVKKVFKRKMAMVDRNEVFAYNTIIICFSKLAGFFELLCE